MNPPEDIWDDVLKWDIKELWAVFREIAKEQRLVKELSEVKKGIRIQCDIRYYTQEWYVEDPKTQKVKIIGYGTYNIFDFLDDKERREDIMRGIILENLTNTGTTKPRTEE